MSKDIKLKKQAGELREQAQAELDEFRDFVTRQAAGELEEGETRLSPEEIEARSQEIQQKFREAKAIEGVDTLDGVMNRPAEEMSDRAAYIRELRNIFSDSPDRTDEKGRFPKTPFKSIGEFFRCVRANSGDYEKAEPLTDDQRVWLKGLRQLATRFGQGEDMYLAEKEVFGEGGKWAKESVAAAEVKTLQGDTTGSGEELVPTEHMVRLLEVMGEQQVFMNRAFRVPMSRRTIDFPRLAQTDATDTRPMFSFAAITKVDEGAQKPEHEPGFQQLTITAFKYAAYTEASDELLMESIVDLPPVLVRLLTNAIAYEYDRDGFRGSGTGEPQGFIGSAAEFAVNRETASQISLQDIFAMESRFFGGTGWWYYHPSTIPQLYALQQNNIIVWNPNVATAAPGTLLGRPLQTTHKLPTLGTKGDLCLVDPQFYLAGDLQRITVANSIHFRFRNDITAWRAVFRGAGTPWPAAPFSHEASGGNMTYRVSPFVILDVVATS